MLHLKKICRILIPALCIIFHVIPTQSKNQSKPWTFLVYMARDNNLSDFGDLNMDQMKAAFNENVNILVYDCHNFNGKKEAQKVVITYNKIQIIQTIPNVDSGDINSFIHACTWAIQDYPSDRIAIIAWNHGAGPLNRYMKHDYLMRGFCYDDTTGNYLDDIKLINALKGLVQLRGGKKIDIFAFDACLMADIEMIAALAPYALYTVASQETIPGAGYPYTTILNWPINKVLSPADFSKLMVNAYQKNYAAQFSDFTLSAIDNAQYQALNQAINALSSLLMVLLTSNNGKSVKAAIDQSINNYFAESTYMDFYTFCTKLFSNIPSMNISDNKLTLQLKNSLSASITAIKNVIIANAKSSNYTYASGLSIYFPDPNVGVESSYKKTYFAQNNSWVKFLNMYSAM